MKMIIKNLFDARELIFFAVGYALAGFGIGVGLCIILGALK